MYQLEKHPQPRSWGLCFIWWEFWGFQAWETVCEATLRELLWADEGESQVYVEFHNKEQVIWRSKYYCKWKKTRYTKIWNLTLSMYGKMQESGLTEISFDMHLSYLGPVLSVFLLLNFLGVHCREWLHFDGNYSSPPQVPSRLSSPWRAAVGDDCDILVYWYGRKYPISQMSHRRAWVQCPAWKRCSVDGPYYYWWGQLIENNCFSILAK